jgi:hypothetical protein
LLRISSDEPPSENSQELEGTPNIRGAVVYPELRHERQSYLHFYVTTFAEVFQDLTNLSDFLADSRPRSGRKNKNTDRTSGEVLLVS